MTAKRAITVEELSMEVRRDGRWVLALEDVRLHVEVGEIVGIVGETGAGKTLTSKAILGLPPRGTRVVRGTVQIGDLDPAPLNDASVMRTRLGREIGTVLQNPASMFDPLMRVGRQMIDGVQRLKLLSRAEAQDRARELLQGIGFDDPDAVLALYPHQLSGGMAQRCAIALTLMPRPLVLVVDEPTSALDAHLRIEVLTLIRRIAERDNAGILLISHDLSLVGEFCDRVLVMYAGRVVETGPMEEVLSAPRHPYTRRLLNSSVTVAARPRAPLPIIDGAPPQPGEWPQGCVFEPRCSIAVTQCSQAQPELRGGVACYEARNGEASTDE